MGVSKLYMSYTDYVFKDGKFVGKFEQMYKESEEVPWHQDTLCNSIWSNIDIEIIKKYNPHNFCELGCGLGYFTKRVRKEAICDTQYPVVGLDISETAISKANTIHNEDNLKFYPIDILKSQDCSRFKLNVLKENPFDFILAKDVLWYVVDNINNFLNNLDILLIADNGYIYISQTFPEVANYYGKEIFPNAKAMSDFFCDRYHFDFECIQRDSRYNNRELLQLVCRKK